MEEKSYVIAKHVNPKMGVFGYWDGLNFITWKGYHTYPTIESAQEDLEMIKWNDKNNCNEDPVAKGAFIKEII